MRCVRVVNLFINDEILYTLLYGFYITLMFV